MIVALTAVLMAVFVGSCAEQTYDPAEAFPRESFDAWVKKHDQQAEKKASGIYMRYHKRDPRWSELPAPVLGKSWLSVSYTARMLSGDIFETRDSTLARLIGSWAVTTHFVPDFVSYNQSQKLCAGLVDALTYMREGDSVRVYIPADLAYSSSMSVNAAYSNANATNYPNFPVYFDIALSKIVDDPYQVELANVKRVAKELGFNMVMDSVGNGLYVRIIDKNPSGDTITADSTAKVWYANYFFDGKLVETNVDSIARQAGYYSSNNKYVAKDLTQANFISETGTYLVYPKAVLRMRRGERAQVIAASWWGPGMSGALTGKPQILPYESMMYLLRVDTLK